MRDDGVPRQPFSYLAVIISPFSFVHLDWLWIRIIYFFAGGIRVFRLLSRLLFGDVGYLCHMSSTLLMTLFFIHWGIVCLA